MVLNLQHTLLVIGLENNKPVIIKLGQPNGKFDLDVRIKSATTAALAEPGQQLDSQGKKKFQLILPNGTSLPVGHYTATTTDAGSGLKNSLDFTLPLVQTKAPPVVTVSGTTVTISGQGKPMENIQLVITNATTNTIVVSETGQLDATGDGTSSFPLMSGSYTITVTNTDSGAMSSVDFTIP
jgi:hypothetical protein